MVCNVVFDEVFCSSVGFCFSASQDAALNLILDMFDGTVATFWVETRVSLFVLLLHFRVEGDKQLFFK